MKSLCHTILSLYFCVFSRYPGSPPDSSSELYSTPNGSTTTDILIGNAAPNCTARPKKLKSYKKVMFSSGAVRGLFSVVL